MELLTDTGIPPVASAALVTSNGVLPSAILLPPPAGHNAENSASRDSLLNGFSNSAPIMTISALASAPPSSILVDTASQIVVATPAAAASGPQTQQVIVLTSQSSYSNAGGLLLDSGSPSPTSVAFAIANGTNATAAQTTHPFASSQKNLTRDGQGTSTLLTFNNANQNTYAFCAVGAALLALI